MTGAFKFVFSNDGNPLVVLLEPSCHELALPVGSSIEITMDYRTMESLETSLTKKYLTIYLWQEGRTRIRIDDVDVTPASVRESD